MFTKVLYIFYLLTFIFVSLWKSTRIFRSYFNFPACRFYPSCSDYFLGAVKKHGLFFGLALGFKRLFKCHPLCEGGVDEVPDTTFKNDKVKVCLETTNLNVVNNWPLRAEHFLENAERL